MESKREMKQTSQSVQENTFIDELQGMSTEDLDEMVHEAKAEEASEINNKGREAQIAYLIGDIE
jgi:hypothetical protein